MNLESIGSAREHVMLGTVVAGLFFGWLAWRSHGFFGKFVFGVLMLCFLAPGAMLALRMNPWLVDVRYRAYRQFYWNIGREMKREQVMSALERRYPVGQPRLRPILVEDSGARIRFYMNPEDKPTPLREEISLQMESGVVISKNYHADP